VNEHEYVGTQVTPINESRSGQWAFKIAARYRPGQATTAWYDPDRPDQAFLLHEASWLPLMFIGMPLGMLGIILIISRLRAAKRLTPIFAPAGRS
jgi:CHASE1-domain containing sensor protein